MNGDLIGRNNPDTASLLGRSRRIATRRELVQMAIDANKRDGAVRDRFARGIVRHIRRAGTSAAITCRTRGRNVPSLFFTTILHDDYHTPRDEPIADRVSEAHADGAVDVRDGLGGVRDARTAGDRSGVQSSRVESDGFPSHSESHTVMKAISVSILALFVRACRRRASLRPRPGRPCVDS